LDYTIDDGAVVPTLARYDGRYYRVYRKGESEARDRAVKRALHAWASMDAGDQAMSLTRVSKLHTILSFSAEVRQVLTPDTLTRGNVATLPADTLDLSGAEIAHYLRDTESLEEVKELKGTQKESDEPAVGESDV